MANRAKRNFTAFMAAPYGAWLLWFQLIPLAIVVFYSFLTKGPYGGVVYEFNLANYARAFDGLYLRIYLASLELAALTALVCLVLGYPMAYCLATASKARRSLLLMLVMVPFLTNFVIRAYAIKVVLGFEGPVNALLIALKLTAVPLILTESKLAVWFGMITNYLPFMVLPLYISLEKFDFTLLEAARDLGASPALATLKVLLPMTKAGIMTGTVLVFIPALGEFVIPDLLGGAKTMLIGNLITEQLLKARDWPFAAALAVLLMVAVVAALILEQILGKRGAAAARPEACP